MLPAQGGSSLLPVPDVLIVLDADEISSQLSVHDGALSIESCLGLVNQQPMISGRIAFELERLLLSHLLQKMTHRLGFLQCAIFQGSRQ